MQNKPIYFCRVYGITIVIRNLQRNGKNLIITESKESEKRINFNEQQNSIFHHFFKAKY